MFKTHRGNTNVALLWSLAVLLFISGGIFGYFIWHKAQEAEQPRTAYMSLGKVVAQVGGGRFIRTEVQLQLRSQKDLDSLQAQRTMVIDAVRKGFSQISDQHIYTVEGKRQAQAAILDHVNYLMGRAVVKGVYFSDFLIAGGR